MKLAKTKVTKIARRHYESTSPSYISSPHLSPDPESRQISHRLLGGRELGDGLGALRDGVLGKLAAEGSARSDCGKKGKRLESALAKRERARKEKARRTGG